MKEHAKHSCTLTTPPDMTKLDQDRCSYLKDVGALQRGGDYNLPTINHNRDIRATARLFSFSYVRTVDNYEKKRLCMESLV